MSADPPSTPPLFASARRPLRFFAVAAFLVVCLGLTWAARVWQTADTQAEADAHRAEIVAEALDVVAADVMDKQTAMRRLAADVAAAPSVVGSLRDVSTRRADGLAAPLVRYASDLDMPPYTAVEVYDVAERLVGWDGFAYPHDTPPTLGTFLQSPSLSVVDDGDVRRALVLWWPVIEADTLFGAVRVVRLLEQESPVQNQYVQSYRLSETWQRETGVPVTVDWAQREAHAAHERALPALYGGVLGVAAATPPTNDALLRAAQARYNDVLAFWAVVLAAWLWAGTWLLYRRHALLLRLRNPARYRAVGLFVLTTLGWLGLRYALIALDVPGRWFTPATPGAWLFDPTTLASAVGGGLARNMGALLITASFGLAFALAFFDFATHLRAQSLRRRSLSQSWRKPTQPSAGRFLVAMASTVLVMLAVALAHAYMVRSVVLDSTLDYFSNTGLLPSSTVLVVFALLLLGTLAVALLLMGVAWLAERVLARHVPRHWPPLALGAAALGAVFVAVLAGYLVTRFFAMYSLINALMYVAAGLGAAVYALSSVRPLAGVFSLRGVLLLSLVLAGLLYPLLYRGMQAQREIRMREAADAFSEQEDSRVLFAMEQALREAERADAVRRVLAEGALADADSLAELLLRSSLLASIPNYESHLAFFDADGRTLTEIQTAAHRAPNLGHTFDFPLVRAMYENRRQPGPMVEPRTGTRERDRIEYVGLVPLENVEGDVVGWVGARTEPRASAYTNETPFPRVLVPAHFAEESEDLSLAEFRDGVLTRTRGDDFGRYRLAEAVEQEMGGRYERWRSERVGERTYRTYYRRIVPDVPGLSSLAVPQRAIVIAVRSRGVTPVDHLYFLLRLTVAALLVAVPAFAAGLVWRWRTGQLRSREVRFRDRVLNRFLLVGIVSVAATGLIGQSVISSENERAIQDGLRRYLNSIEQALLDVSRPDERTGDILERVRVDSLAARLGLDLNVYRGYELLASSRPQLVQQQLISQRLPIEAYDALFVEGQRFAVTEERVGTFPYTVGYHALTFEADQPNYSIGVLSLPEEERIREERARITAYFFGALLLLLLTVMGTATVLANRLAQPIVRLRSGLEAVGKGKFSRPIPVTTHDEFGDLVRTFNNLRQQLDESRRTLAQQERELAWREMARQVAHEIKNPLMPMKLSVQHLQQVWLREKASASPKFAEKFDNVTARLLEQIETLTRIANEFSSFARLPQRRLEHTDLNEVVLSAVALVNEEITVRANVELDVDLHTDALVVEADVEELRRVFINLMKNALQATPPEVTGTITVRTFPRHDAGDAWAVCEVTDTGTGIPDDVQPKIFQPNFSTKTSGMGLGLAIVKKSIEDVRGTIDFETEEGTGTTFRVQLPLAE